MRRLLCLATIATVLTLFDGTGHTAPQDSRSVAVMDTIQVIASRLPVGADRMPGTVTVVQGDELRRRGATDLRSALALASGVEAVPGGDAGPAGAVPALWGLREFDAFLLVVDGIPWGAAFIPDLPTLDLNDVERIEVQRGPAPITFGATSFVGVIHVIHRAAGAGQGSATVSGGSYGTLRGAVSSDLGNAGRISVDGAHQGFADDDAGVDRAHARYRVKLPADIGIDADFSIVNQDPTSPQPRLGDELDPAIPIDSNQNPANSRIDRTRFQIAANQSTPIVDWTAAFSRVQDDLTRGYLAEDAIDDGSTPNANGYTQEREFTEFYAELHHRFAPRDDLGLVLGADLIFGEGREESSNFTYYAPFDGNDRLDSSTGIPVEDTEFEAERTFSGIFGEAEYRPWTDWTFLVGLRMNLVNETREGESEDDMGNEMPATVKADDSRLGGRAGVSWEAWRSGQDRLAVYADYRNTFKPAAIDFGPEAEIDPLDPETAQSVEIGAHSDLVHARLHLDASAFRMDFENLVVATTIDGRPGLTNAGTQRFDGLELEAEWDFDQTWHAIGTWAWHEARFRDYVREADGVTTDFGGNYLELSPKYLAAAGLAWTYERYDAQAIANYIGSRYLDKHNRYLADAYVTLDAAVGVHVRDLDVRLAGHNLTDRRDPVAESELGDAQYYRLPACSVELSATVSFP